MTKLRELQNCLDARAGVAVAVKESAYDRDTRFILDMKLKLEKIQNGINELKGLPQSSPLLKESLQCGLDGRAGVQEIKRGKKSSREDLQEGLADKIKARAGVRSGDIESSKVADIQESVALALEERVDQLEGKESDLGGLISLREATYDPNLNEVMVVLIEAGSNAEKKRYYPHTTLQEAAPKFSGLKMYLNHPTSAEERERPERDITKWASTIVESYYQDGKVMARVAVHDSWLRERLADPVARANIGLSINTGGKIAMEKIGSQNFEVVQEILFTRKAAGPASVDWVTEAGARGRVA